MPTLTKRQKQILDFIEAYINKAGISPTFEEICKYTRKAFSTVHEHVQALVNKGYLIKNDNLSRGLELNKNDSMVKIPILGTIAAGQPIEVVEKKETIAVPKYKLLRQGHYFGLQVSGDSMKDENIHDGDVVLVKQQESANNGQKIVALINNNEATLKKFYKENNYIRLQPANKKFASIILDKTIPFNIQGVVIDVIKNSIDLQAKELSNTIEVKRSKELPINKIIQGDTVKELKKLPDASCDVIVIDPPYNIGKDFGNNIDKRELSEYVLWSKSWINECLRIMKPTSTMFIYGFSEILAYLSVEIPINKRWLIWHYTNKNVASLNFWQRSHEAIICAWKEKPVFNRDLVREPYTEGFLNGAAGKVRAGTKGRFSRDGKETIYKAHEGGALPRDVIKIPALAGGAGMVERWFLCKTCNDVFEPQKLKKHLNHEIIKHPTQKPLDLSKKLIESSMPSKDGIVLVPFVGMGSECIAAKELGQNYIGFEINPDYIKIAEKVLSQVKFAPKLL